jgi:hypothetical protein
VNTLIIGRGPPFEVADFPTPRRSRGRGALHGPGFAVIALGGAAQRAGVPGYGRACSRRVAPMAGKQPARMTGHC